MGAFFTILGIACGASALVVALGRFVERIREQEHELAQAAREDDFVRLEGAVSLAEARLRQEGAEHALETAGLRGRLEERRHSNQSPQFTSEQLLGIANYQSEIRKEHDAARKDAEDANRACAEMAREADRARAELKIAKANFDTLAQKHLETCEELRRSNTTFTRVNGDACYNASQGDKPIVCGVCDLCVERQRVTA